VGSSIAEPGLAVLVKATAGCLLCSTKKDKDAGNLPALTKMAHALAVVSGQIDTGERIFLMNME
jgi:hypothetical protein